MKRLLPLALGILFVIFSLALLAALSGYIGAQENPKCQVDVLTDSGYENCNRIADHFMSIKGGFGYLGLKKQLRYGVWICHDHYLELLSE